MATYIVLIPDNEKEWAAADESERQRVYGKHREFSDAHAERGHKMTGGAELAESTAAKVVRRSASGGLAITDGPYAETKEQLGGYYLINARDLNDAIQIASRIPSARTGAIEVRPIMEFS